MTGLDMMSRAAKVRLFFELRRQLQSDEKRTDDKTAEIARQAAMLALSVRQETAQLVDEVYWADNAADLLHTALLARESELERVRGELAVVTASSSGRAEP